MSFSSGAKGVSDPSVPNFGNLGPMLQYTLGQNMQRVRDTYANLGLGGSSMEAQDLAGATSANAAQGAELSFQAQQQQFQDALQLAQLQTQQSGNFGFNLGSLFGGSSSGTGATPALF